MVNLNNISKFRDNDGNGGNMDKSQKRRRQFVIPSSDTPEVFEALEKAFDLITVFVEDFTVFLRISR